MPTYRECNEAAERLRSHAAGMLDLADFIENKGVRLPSIPHVAKEMDYNVWLTSNDSGWNEETKQWESTFNEFRTSANVLKFVKAIGTCEKKYVNDTLEIRKKFGSVVLEGNVKRDLVCTKKVVKEEWVEPRMEDGYFKREFEWTCEEVSLLGLAKYTEAK